MLKIITINDEQSFILRKKTNAVKVFDDKIRELAENMLIIMKSNEGIGLAAPQIGFDKSIFVIQLPKQKPIIFINPKLIETSTELFDMEERCLSVPNVSFLVTRPKSVKIQAKNLNGENFIINANGLMGRVIQHEYDHLIGKLYIDKI